MIIRGNEEPGFFAQAVGMCRGESPLKQLPENQRTNESRYVCLIVVKDYHRLRTDRRDATVWHYSRIEPAILSDVRAGRAALVFDLSNEGPAYDTDIFEALYTWIETEHLPAGRCIWMAQNRLMRTAAYDHAGARAALIRFEQYDYFVKLMAWNFSRMGADETSVHPDAYLKQLFDVSRKDKLLLCLNATPRLGRVLTVAALHHLQLLDRSIVSFAGMDYVKSGVSLPKVLEYLDAHPELEVLRESVYAIGTMSPVRVDNFAEQGNALVEKIDRSVYERTFFSLVTESDFSEQRIERVTEKTVKAFCMGHPTLIVGNAHSIDLMRSYGFEDWSALDRTADAVADPAARFGAIFAEVLVQTQRINAEPRTWIEAVRDISIHNHRYAVSGAFLQRYVETVDRPLVERMEALIAD